MRTGRSKLDFVEKLQFMQRMIDECLDRLLFQSSYLAEKQLPGSYLVCKMGAGDELEEEGAVCGADGRG